MTASQPRSEIIVFVPTAKVAERETQPGTLGTKIVETTTADTMTAEMMTVGTRTAGTKIINTTTVETTIAGRMTGGMMIDDKMIEGRNGMMTGGKMIGVTVDRKIAVKMTVGKMTVGKMTADMTTAGLMAVASMIVMGNGMPTRMDTVNEETIVTEGVMVTIAAARAVTDTRAAATLASVRGRIRAIAGRVAAIRVNADGRTQAVAGSSGMTANMAAAVAVGAAWATRGAARETAAATTRTVAGNANEIMSAIRIIETVAVECMGTTLPPMPVEGHEPAVEDMRIATGSDAMISPYGATMASLAVMGIGVTMTWWLAGATAGWRMTMAMLGVAVALTEGQWVGTANGAATTARGVATAAIPVTLAAAAIAGVVTTDSCTATEAAAALSPGLRRPPAMPRRQHRGVSGPTRMLNGVRPKLMKPGHRPLTCAPALSRLRVRLMRSRRRQRRLGGRRRHGNKRQYVRTNSPVHWRQRHPSCRKSLQEKSGKPQRPLLWPTGVPRKRLRPDLRTCIQWFGQRRNKGVARLAGLSSRTKNCESAPLN